MPGLEEGDRCEIATFLEAPNASTFMLIMGPGAIPFKGKRVKVKV